MSKQRVLKGFYVVIYGRKFVGGLKKINRINKSNIKLWRKWLSYDYFVTIIVMCKAYPSIQTLCLRFTRVNGATWLDDLGVSKVGCVEWMIVLLVYVEIRKESSGFNGFAFILEEAKWIDVVLVACTLNGGDQAQGWVWRCYTINCIIKKSVIKNQLN